MTEQRYYTLNELEKLTGKSTRTFRRWIDKGKLKARKAPLPGGFQYLVARSEVMAQSYEFENKLKEVKNASPTN